METDVVRTKLMKADVNYLAAKLEEIHEDVRQLQEHVDALRQESAGRKAVTKVLMGSVAVLGSVVGWLTTHIVRIS